jgi:hypothetical protein
MRVIDQLKLECKEFTAKVFPPEISEHQRVDIERSFLMGAFLGYQLAQDADFRDLLQFREELKKYVGEALVQEFDQ